MIFSVKYCKTFLLIGQNCSKINGADLRPGGLLYYSLCHNNNTFRTWSSLFRKHAPSKIFAGCFCQNFREVFLPVCPFINCGDFCQPPRLLFWPKFASLPVYSTLPFYLKLESRCIVNCCPVCHVINFEIIVGLSPSKKNLFHLLQWKPFKNDGSSLCYQYI